ncbi:MAG TPA: DNA-formamidopyrimidine glycosylase family protein [Thermoanaerobaculia bacterium]|nr:DNA-formamidopyrimidine glycosylase family protein [Thermoanaerobaculia bacterium]
MPELPEVEMYARYFARHALEQTIAHIRVLDTRILGTRSLKPLVGRAFHGVRRHGKHLFADAGDLWLRLHFGMTGDLAYFRDDPPRFARVIFDFENGMHLAYEDARLFGVVDIARTPENFVREYGLGPDPLEPKFTLPAFRKILHKRRGRVKSLLLSQDIIAGIGNLYADEALFRAAVDPRKTIDRMTDDAVKALYLAIRSVLKEAIAFKSRGADYPARFLVPHREEGDRCPRCGGTIRRTVVATRTTYYCAKHQR